MDAQYSLKHMKLSLSFEVNEISSLVGRSSNCDIQVDKETLSREHARLSLRRDGIYIQDLHSTNGTFVNELQIHEETLLTPGDVVRFGQESFYLQCANADATVVFDSKSLSNSDSAMLVEDEEEEDGTVMLQSISLPAGWSSSGSSLDEEDLTLSELISEDDKALLKALKQHARMKLQHAEGLLITRVQDKKAPTVKLLSTERTKASWNIGRSLNADISLNDQRVSEQHAQISFDDGTWSLVDTDSRNGTLQNGHHITKIGIKKGERSGQVEIGPFTLIFEAISK